MPRPMCRVLWRLRIATSVALAGCLVAATPAPGADDDELSSRQENLDERISQQQVDLHEISTDLVDAQSRLDTALGRLIGARSELTALRRQVREAVHRDVQLQERLDRAVVRLDNALADRRQGRVDVAAKRAMLTGYAVSSYQTGGVDSFGLDLAFNATTAEQAVDTLQDADAVLNKQAVDLQELQAMQVLLNLTSERVHDTRDAVAEQREDAAAHLALQQRLERRAAEAADQVKEHVALLRDERSRLAAAKTAEIARLAVLEAERQQVADQLRRLAERRARQRAASVAAAAEAAAEAAAQAATRPPPPPATPSDTGAGADTGGGYLSYPGQSTYITSPYGMRMHPILHVYKLHDGTDFSASCGTPVYAAAEGTVLSQYFNEGYGNRVIIDHGYVQGVSLSTSYNHLTSFALRPGSPVSRGQVIGFAGTTGYSTGCHLHFMVYVNGATVDPMSWL
ncbi:MAG TPA: peptidoglycan DD-metalloendopeptidase family protein [Nocardioidaceae bacterium]|nr:peptidoglycan DD-metalloendopeptidase family protein [Nocardioidaceae bacterium]